MDYEKLANLFFSDIDKTPDDFEKIYPKRNLPEGAKVTRLGPSPTGFIHLGNLFGALADERMAHQSNGIAFLRVEDTDEKREVEGAIPVLLSTLSYFGINFDEGEDLNGNERGNYGPYKQSERKEIYRTCVKYLMQKGMAYPCFMSEEEIDAIRKDQEANKINPGIYGQYAKHRDLSLEEIEKRLAAGEKPVIRFRSPGLDGKTVTAHDAIRGDITMPENLQDVVILKKNDLPTYHFAHVVDDHFMRTSVVVRGEEWLATWPIHIQLFAAMGWDMPEFCHNTVLMKIDEETGQKRKLSKRKDPELSLEYYKQQGYLPDAVREYLMTVLNSDFEEWRIANQTASIDEFDFEASKMSGSGTMFDLNKLNDVSKDVFARKTAPEIYDFLKQWADDYHADYSQLFADKKDMIIKVLDIDRGGEKPRKDLVYAEQIFKFIKYFFDEYFEYEDDFPAECEEDRNTILDKYIESYNSSDDNSAWFDKVKAITEELGYAVKPKDYKKNPDQYKGHVGHVSGVIRVAITGRTNSPDLWTIQQILGEEKVKERIAKAKK